MLLTNLRREIWGGVTERLMLSRRLIQLILVFCVIFCLNSDRMQLSQSEYAASKHLFHIESWVINNILRLGFSQMINLVRNDPLSHSERLEEVEDFFQLGKSIREFQSETDLEFLGSGSESLLPSSGVSAMSPSESMIIDLRARKEKLQASVESILAGELALVSTEQGLSRGIGPFHVLWPPVAFRIAPVPKLLVVSPRDRIFLEDTQLLDSDISLADINLLESELSENYRKSVLVVRISGLATYPSLIADNSSLRELLHTAAHEWLHQYWFFYPFGRSYFNSTEMTILNETAADIAGRELGDLAYNRLKVADPSEFLGLRLFNSNVDGFEGSMREIRFITDELLEQGQIDEAESYMEDQRENLVNQGYYIRKLNQAYFAFHGTYAESPESVSPIAGQLHRLRRQADNVGEFIRTVAQFETYGQFTHFVE